MRTQSFLTIAALALSAPLAACATSVPSGYATAGIGASYGASAGYAPTHDDDGLLPEPPANAKAGQCFAKVVVPGQPVYGPPAGPHLKWVQSPPPAGAIGPVWCQVWEQGYQPTISLTPERYGWIRVICDKDATKDKIGHLQHRLHDWGYYNGGYGGDYDQSTSEAVKRFQSERHIEHGGYLSYKTMETLESAPPAPVAPPVTYAQGYGASYGYAQQGYGSPCGPAPCQQPPIVYQPPVYQPPQIAYQPPVYQPPCGPVPCQAPPPPCGPQPCQGGGYGQWGGGQWGGGQGGQIRGRAYLTWAGKTGYR